MKVGLFIPCYIDQFYPQVGIATLQLLEKTGIKVNYPAEQTCCGQPMANAGYERYGKGSAELFLKNFSEFDYVVSPSGSCVMHIKEHLAHLTHSDEAVKLQQKIFELCEFLTDIVKLNELSSSFPHKVGLHPSCHGLRGLRLASASELTEPPYNKPRNLLEKVAGIQIADLTRKDECCGFGGTFAVSEEAISVRMGNDRLQDHIQNGVEVITGADMSCLMHLEGLARRQKLNIKILHIAEILNSESPA